MKNIAYMKNSTTLGSAKPTRLLTLNFSLLTVLLCFLFGGKAWGQESNQLLFENFNNMSSISTSYSSTGWYAYNAGSGNNWTLNTSSDYAYSGSNSAQVKYHSSNPANCYLVSKPFTISAGMAEETYLSLSPALILL